MGASASPGAAASVSAAAGVAVAAAACAEKGLSEAVALSSTCKLDRRVELRVELVRQVCRDLVLGLAPRGSSSCWCRDRLQTWVLLWVLLWVLFWVLFYCNFVFVFCCNLHVSLPCSCDVFILTTTTMDTKDGDDDE